MSAIKVYQEWQAKGVITPLDKCEVGKLYNVMTGYSVFYGLFLPIVPYPHSDAELGADWEHWHYDTRFFTAREIKKLMAVEGRTSNILPCKQGLAYKTEVRIQRLKCRRLELGGLPRSLATGMKFSQWARGMVGKSCKGKRCPHQGSNMVERPGGLLECPLHGLFADANTETIITRGEGISRLKEAYKE